LQITISCWNVRSHDNIIANNDRGKNVQSHDNIITNDNIMLEFKVT